MAPVFDVCIRGAGVVGRSLALLLAAERLRVALVEDPATAAPDTGDIRAYALNAASRALLQSLRGWPDPDHCTPVRAMEVRGDTGATARFDAQALRVDALAWIVDLPALQLRLREALRYQPLVETVAAPVTAALTVVCEGRNSATRAEFGVAFDAVPYPQRAIAARLDHPGRPHGGTARQWFTDDGVLALLPIGGPGGTATALVWSAAQGRAAELIAMDGAAFAAAVDEAVGSLPGTSRTVGARADWPLQRASADRWTGPMPAAAMPGTVPARAAAARSWVLAGDAAHTIHPLAGQGLNLGLGDAAELAAVLRSRDYWRSVGDLRLLRRYERARKAALWPLMTATDGLQQLFAQPGAAWQGVRNWGLRGFNGSGALKAWAARQAMGRLMGAD